MPRRTLDSRFGLILVSSLVACVTQVGGCRSDDGPLHMDEEGGASSGGSADGGTSATGGSVETGGTASDTGGNPSTGGTGAVEGGTTSTEGGSQSGAGGNPDGGSPAPTGGTNTITGGAGGAGGFTEGGAGGDMGTSRCVYYTPGDEVVDQGGAGGAGPPLTVKSMKSSFVGAYLADGAGKALYTYGADFPGDCNNLPITNCFKDCAISWPPFNGEPRNLGNNLDDSLFGTIERVDGTVDAPIVSRQMTYMGWPLYYYKSDLAPNDTKGHASGVWQLATVIPPNIMVIRVPSGTTTVRVVSDEGGHTLYTYANDTKGTATSAPKSACTGSCLDAFEPFALTYLSPVSYLPPSNFSFFVRSDGAPQIAYKGAPLYLSRADTRSGQSNGLATPGWSVAAQ